MKRIKKDRLINFNTKKFTIQKQQLNNIKLKLN